jgi:Uma2 family endonuclease
VSLVLRHATYEDLLRLAEEPFAEIVDGNLYTSPKPPIPRAVAAVALASVLANTYQVGGNAAGDWWLLFEPELQLADDILVPDLAGWRRQRLAQPPETVALDLVPDWVCEIVSPETQDLDRSHKLPAYARHGISSIWMVDPQAQSLEVLQAAAGGFVLAGRFTGEDLARAQPFDAVEIDLRWLWGTPRGEI